MKGKGLEKDNPNYKENIIYKCVFCQKETNTPSDKNRAKKYCNNICQMKYEHRSGLRKYKSIKTGWAKKYTECITCHKTDKRHYGKGNCMKCYNLKYASNSPKKTLPERDDIV